MSSCMRRFVTWMLVALLVALAGGVAAQERRLEPVDEGATDPSWISFRNRLLSAAESRDRKFLLGILDRNVRGGISGNPGVADFVKLWDMDAEDSILWRELKAALFLGSAWITRDSGRRELCAPYLLGKWPQDSDPHDHGVIITRDVLVKAAPSNDSPTLQTVTYDLVEVGDWEVPDRAQDVKQRWVKVRVKAGEGYVPEEQIRSPIEHVACFVKSGGVWRMTALAPAGG